MYLDLPDSVKGYCDRVLRRKFIVIDSKMSEDDQRFICAHELGHMLLHRGLNHYFITRKTYFPIGRYEREANGFAVSLLTVNQSKEDDETVGWFLSRCGVPEEMHQFAKFN